jgi:hypothetical protein
VSGAATVTRGYATLYVKHVPRENDGNGEGIR